MKKQESDEQLHFRHSRTRSRSIKMLIKAKLVSALPPGCGLLGISDIIPAFFFLYRPDSFCLQTGRSELSNLSWLHLCGDVHAIYAAHILSVHRAVIRLLLLFSASRSPAPKLQRFIRRDPSHASRYSNLAQTGTEPALSSCSWAPHPALTQHYTLT